MENGVAGIGIGFILTRIKNLAATYSKREQKLPGQVKVRSGLRLEDISLDEFDLPPEN